MITGTLFAAASDHPFVAHVIRMRLSTSDHPCQNNGANSRTPHVVAFEIQAKKMAAGCTPLKIE